MTPTHVVGGCGCCPPKPLVLDMDEQLHPGFGMVYIKRNGRLKWPFGEENPHEDITGRKIEEVAANSSPARWEIEIYGPLFGCIYRRVKPGVWTMVERNKGFA